MEKKKNCFYKETKTLYRGSKETYINLLPYERLKGKIILFSAFTSISESKKIALGFSSRDKIEKIYKDSKRFSVLYIIKNYVKKNCAPCGIDIQSVSDYEEEEILFQPFSFYLVEDVKFDYKKYCVDIYLKTVSKKEIFEEKIRKGQKVVYDEKEDIMVIS